MSSAASAARPARILLLLGQSPFDPTSGAAQSMRQIAQLFADGGAEVRVLATTATEGAVDLAFEKQLAALDATAITRETRSDHTLWRAHVRGLVGDFFAVEHARRFQWEELVGPAYDQRLAEIVREFMPDVALTFGGDPGDARRRKQLRAHGTRVVFALHNLAYLPHTLTDVDEFLAPTEFLARRYRDRWERPVTVLPPPVDPVAVRAPQREPVCICFINPEPAKGAAIVARLAHRLGRERPDVPLLVCGGRAPSPAIEGIAQHVGFSLREFPNVLLAPPTLNVAEVWSTCRVLLAPSIVEEAAGRVALEAMLNGAVPIVSDRGGLPEMVGEAGHVVPLPPELTVSAPFAVGDTVTDAIWDRLLRLIDDPAHFSALSATARIQGEKYTTTALAPRYFAWLMAQLACPAVRGNPD